MELSITADPYRSSIRPFNPIGNLLKSSSVIAGIAINWSTAASIAYSSSEVVNHHSELTPTKFDPSPLDWIQPKSTMSGTATDWVHESRIVLANKISFDRILELSELPDGWMGPESKAASREAISDAFALMKRFVNELPEAQLPGIGLDSDGHVVFSWSTNNLIGNLSVYGDGTYSYFVENSGKTAREDEAQVMSPFLPEFYGIFSG